MSIGSIGSFQGAYNALELQLSRLRPRGRSGGASADIAGTGHPAAARSEERRDTAPTRGPAARAPWLPFMPLPPEQPIGSGRVASPVPEPGPSPTSRPTPPFMPHPGPVDTQVVGAPTRPFMPVPPGGPASPGSPDAPTVPFMPLPEPVDTQVVGAPTRPFMPAPRER